MGISFRPKASPLKLPWECVLGYTPLSGMVRSADFKLDITRGPKNAAMWTAPGWQEKIFTSLDWSVQPFVRPVDAVHMTAGHNALRGSGPGKPSFDYAMAQSEK